MKWVVNQDEFYDINVGQMTEKIYTIPVVSGVFIVNFEQILCRLILIDTLSK